MSFYSNAFWQSYYATLSWFAQQGILVSFLFAAAPALLIWDLIFMTPKLKTILGTLPYAALQGLALLIAGATVVFICVFATYFISYAPEQIRLRDDRIAQLGGAPDSEVKITKYMTAADKVAALNKISSLSNFINSDGVAACKMAREVLSYGNDISVTGKPEFYRKKAEDTFILTRKIYATILGTHNDDGLLKSGDPLIISIMSQAIEPKGYGHNNPVRWIRFVGRQFS